MLAATYAFIAKGLPENTSKTLEYPISDFKFAFGSGIPLSKSMRVDQFANGYALLSSGPVSIQAKQQRVLSYNWQPPHMPQEAAFFWRRSDDQQKVLRAEITVAGNYQIDLSTEPDWRGEITEFGFLLAGVNGEVIEVGDVSLMPDSLITRLQLTWSAWAAFEEWSQQSINFMHGGDYRQLVALPLLVFAWLLATLVLYWLITGARNRVGPIRLQTTAGMLFLLAWLLLDVRWTTNNIRQMQASLQSQWLTDDQQRSNNTLDGDLFQYIQSLKSDVLGKEPARILIIGDENAVDYYLFRAKYHLLPHSVNVATAFAKGQAPASLDYVIFFGQAENIVKVPGWRKAWRKSLMKINHGEWGVVYRVE